MSSWEDLQTHVLFQFYFFVIKKMNISELNVIDNVVLTCKIEVLRNIRKALKSIRWVINVFRDMYTDIIIKLKIFRDTPSKYSTDNMIL